jgi:hypothetical protein
MEQPQLLQLPEPEKKEDASPKKSPPITVSGAELAEWLGVTAAAITQGRNTGFFVMSDDGKYKLKESIRRYVSLQRGRKGKTEASADLKKQIDYWNIQNAKQKNRDFRIQYGQGIAMAIIDQLTDIFINAKHAIAKSPEVLKFFDDAIESLSNADIDLAIMETEDIAENEIAGSNPQ